MQKALPAEAPTRVQPKRTVKEEEYKEKKRKAIEAKRATATIKHVGMVRGTLFIILNFSNLKKTKTAAPKFSHTSKGMYLLLLPSWQINQELDC